MRERIHRALTSEGGYAVPTVMLMTVAALGIASVSVTTSIDGQGGVVRDQGGKVALAAAESGVNQALLYYNRDTAPCVPASAGQWCGPVEGVPVNGGSISYWARLASGSECEVANEVECVEIVSVGNVNGVSRRVNVMASSLVTDETGGPGPFASAGVLSLDTITLKSNATIHTGTATNGDLELESNARQCGPVSVGVGREVDKKDNAGQYSDYKCKTPTGTYLQQPLTLPLVNQGDAASVNDNGRFFSLDKAGAEPGNVCWSKKRADGGSGSCGTRELRLDSNSTLTIGGKTYSFCKLVLNSNSAIYIASSATFYFDSPEACGYKSGTTQLDLESNSRITAATGASVAMLFVGSSSRKTNIQLNSNSNIDGPCEQNFVVYAPLSEINFESNSKFCGAIAGKSINLNSNSEIWSAKGSESYNLPGVEVPETPAHYTPYRFVECSGVAPASAPDTGC